MTEKEFKTVINDLELTIDARSKIKNDVINFLEKIKESISNDFEVVNSDIIGSMATNLLTKDDNQIDLVIYINNETNTIRRRIILNALENAVYFLNASAIGSIERDQNQKTIMFNNKTGYNYKIWLVENEKEYSYLKKWSLLVDNINQKYTIFKNTIKLIKHYIKEEELKGIDENIVTVILAYALDRYQTGNKYYQYLDSFVKGLDDFANKKRIVLLDEYLVLNKQELKAPEGVRYEVLNPLDNSINIALDITELKVQDYRKLRKKLVKEIETEKEEDYVFDNSTEVAIDVEPILNAEEKYMWHYEVIGKGLSNDGGLYDNTYENYLTALLKGTFKGLKTIVDKGLIKKKIYISSKYGNIFVQDVLINDENKSRMKTIKSLIEQNKLNVFTIKK